MIGIGIGFRFVVDAQNFRMNNAECVRVSLNLKPYGLAKDVH